jgi:glucokinase
MALVQGEHEVREDRASTVLAADVGGTNTRMALFRSAGATLECLETRVVPSRSDESLEQVLRAFLADLGGTPPDAACLAIAGPVIDEAVSVTNLPWKVEARALSRALSIERLRLMNDLEATALGMLHLPDDAFAILQTGSRPAGAGHVAVVAAGTGFGEAALVWDGERHQPMATEGGHSGFAPRDERGLALWQHLRRAHGRVSVERVVSGPGLAAIYALLRADSSTPEPPALASRIAESDPSAVVAEAGLAGEDPICAEALAFFVESYGAAAGDAALRHLALGGVILGGGIAPKILPALREPRFLAAFLDKGRFGALLATLRVSVCLAPNPALEGAAHLALRAI